MSLLFDVSTDDIGLHISHILKEKELDASTTEESSVVQLEGARLFIYLLFIFLLNVKYWGGLYYGRNQ